MRFRAASAGRSQRRLGLRLGLTAVAAVVVAEGAVWLLRPREQAVDPVTVSERSYFSEEQIERGRDYRDGQRLLLLGAIGAQGAVLVLLAAGRPGAARRLLERAGEHPIRGGALVAAGLYAGVSLVGLPFALAAHERAVDVGLSTQSLGGWLGDLAKSETIGLGISAGAGAIAVGLMRRFGRRWWVPASAVVVAFEVIFIYLAPVLLAPLFNRFDRLEPGPARSDTLELAERADVEIGEVYRVDASRRGTGLNAYVGGLGPTKRVVLYDTLLEDLDRSQRRSVIAHELAHAKGRDIPRGLLFAAIATPLALLLAAGVSEALARRRGLDPHGPAALPGLALTLALVGFAIGVIGNQLSRQVEARADTFALEITDDPEGLVGLQKRLVETNVSDPDPPEALHLLLGTHPTAVERIGAAVAWQRGERP